MRVACALAVLLVTSVALAKGTTTQGEPLRLEVPNAPDAYYFKPQARGMKPVLLYLHGRGGNPAEDCRKWAKVGTQFGWVVCPSGPSEGPNGGRAWSNGAPDAQRIIDATLQALRTKWKGRVQRKGNVLMGFSEGAFIAMQVGLADQSTWSKWLILGASDQYWSQDLTEPLSKAKRKVQRVYLITGENDGVAPNTLKVGGLLKKNKVPVKVRLVPGMGHEVPADRMVITYRRPLAWLVAAH